MVFKFNKESHFREFSQQITECDRGHIF